ncbi:MAG TPA: hypothetical protein VEX68_25120 [Bryobacteraceae bacterium]|nr:hypothetical protein [Bryobacteraceae bacterium]
MCGLEFEGVGLFAGDDLEASLENAFAALDDLVMTSRFGVEELRVGDCLPYWRKGASHADVLVTVVDLLVARPALLCIDIRVGGGLLNLLCLWLAAGDQPYGKSENKNVPPIQTVVKPEFL